jgi:anti-sigma B factor antagonist
MAVHQEPTVSIQRQAHGTTVEVEVDGELDIASAPDLHREIELALLDEPERVVVDLRGVTFIDSTGISTLLRLRTRATERCVDMLVIRPIGEADQIFEICGIQGVFPKLDGA